MKKITSILLAAIVCISSCKKESGDQEEPMMSATINGVNWMADTAIAFYVDDKHLVINGWSTNGMYDSSISIRLFKPKKGTNKVDADMTIYNPPASNDWNLVAVTAPGGNNAITVQRITGTVNIESISSNKVIGNFYIQYSFNSPQYNFPIEKGNFVAIIR